MAISYQPRERAARIRVGSYEFKKVGISRFDLRDPYHLAVTLTWPGGVRPAFTAILTGPTFVRFSRPRARLIFAANPVIVTHNKRPTLMLLVGNGRPGVLTDATAKLNVLLSETAADGRLLRRIFVTLEARDPTLATSVHDIRTYAPEDIRFGVRYRDPVVIGDDGLPVLNLTTIGALDPDGDDRGEIGWTEREEGWG